VQLPILAASLDWVLARDLWVVGGLFPRQPDLTTVQAVHRDLVLSGDGRPPTLSGVLVAESEKLPLAV
jgi:hypothetical protein